MDYIGLHTRYWTMHASEAFSPADSHLFSCLVYQFNSKGQGKLWPESLKWTDGALAQIVGMDAKAMVRARTRLEDRSLIEVTTSGQGNRKGATYRLLTSPKKGEVETDVEGEVEGEVAPTSPKKGEVDKQLTPQHLPQHTPQHTPKRENSYIYKEVQTPDIQTPNNSLSNDTNAGEKTDLLGAQKKGAIGHPPTPFQDPIPIPPGKVYGDGTLQSAILIFYAQNPDRFPLKIYMPFLRYWGALNQKGDPAQIGRERWRTRWGDQWHLEERLDEWYKRELNPKNGSNQTTPTGFHARQQSAEPQSVDDYGNP